MDDPGDGHFHLLGVQGSGDLTNLQDDRRNMPRRVVSPDLLTNSLFQIVVERVFIMKHNEEDDTDVVVPALADHQ